jgi:hypothetical protein
VSFRVYFKPFDPYGEYMDTYQEVTNDVDDSSFSSIQQKIEGSDFDLGVFIFGSLPLTMKNESGNYSDVDAPESIFNYSRNDTLVKITYQSDEFEAYAGVMRANYNRIGPEVTVFEGLLNDESLKMDIDSQKVNFQVLSKDSLFSKIAVQAGEVANGDLISDALYALLNKAKIKKILTITAINLVPGADQIIDDASEFETKTVSDVINELLLISNSILRIDANNVVYVSDRTASTNVMAYFYGQASQSRPENIKAIKNIRSGVNRVFNLLTWSGSAAIKSDGTSALYYGVRKKELSSNAITDFTKQNNALQSLLTEFGNPKQEFDLSVPINYTNLALELLDKVSIDYPTVLYESEGAIPICGLAVYGTAFLPGAFWSIEISSTTYYKIMGKTINRTKDEIVFKMRQV